MANNWKFEQSSGFDGYRCQGCGLWVYEGQPLICKCSIREKITILEDKLRDIGVELKGEKDKLRMYLRMNRGKK